MEKTLKKGLKSFGRKEKVFTFAAAKSKTSSWKQMGK
jgi:hypothetical protein